MKSIIKLLIFPIAILWGCKTGDAKKFYLFAIDAQKAGDYNYALELLNKANKIEPNNLTILDFRGEIKLFLNDTTGAINDYKTMIVIDSSCKKSFYNIALILAYMGNHKDALQYFNLVKNNEKVTLDVEYFRLNDKFKYCPGIQYDAYFYYKGYSNFCYGNYKSAFNDFTSCINLNNNFVALSYYMRAYIFFNIGKKELACQEFNTAIKKGMNITEDEYQDFCN